jgi:glucose-6-phosphate 1-epimerase
MSTTYWRKKMELPGRVSFMEGNGELPKTEITTGASMAEIYFNGAHLTHFQKKGEPAVLFLSRLSRFESGSPIRGGVPVIFPWFGPREGQPMHGFARTTAWELKEIVAAPDGTTLLKFTLPDSAEASLSTKFAAEYNVTVGTTLGLELVVTNGSADQDFTFEACLHSYFNVGDINAVSVTGLKGVSYLDKCENYARKIQTSEHVKILRETDQVYLDTGSVTEIHDSSLGRRLRIETAGANSTVLWNPWIAKSQQMPDFGNDEYLRMICVESGNVADNRVTLPAGKSCSLRAVISTHPL